MMSEYALQETIKKMSKMYNYYEGKFAIKILSSLSEPEKKVVLSDSSVQQTILNIDDVDLLKEIFRKSPAFFQEIMFNKESIQEKLMSPTKNLTSKKLAAKYNTMDYHFDDKGIKNVKVFLKNVKSPLIFEQLTENKFFQRIIALCKETQISKNFFQGIDVKNLYYNIINDPDIYNTKKSRKKHIIYIFNKVCSSVLLPNDYNQIVDFKDNFFHYKRKNIQPPLKIDIDKQTLDILTQEMLIQLVSIKNINNEFIKDYLKEKVTSELIAKNYDFDKILPNVKRPFDFNCLEYMYIQIIIEQDDLVKQKFVSYICDILLPDNTFNETDKSSIKELLTQRILKNSISYNAYKELLIMASSIKTAFYLKFNKISRSMNYIEFLSPEQLLHLNTKHINQIIKLINIPNEDELSLIYAYAIKLYFAFGLERTLGILKNEYGEIEQVFYDNAIKLDVSNINLIKEGSKYIPEIKENFIKFLFANPKENHFIDMLKDKSSLLYKNWRYVYNNFEKLKEECHNQLTLAKINIILKEMSPTRDINDVSPSDYRLNENNILTNVCLGNKTKYVNEEIYQELRKIYNEMKKRTTSSIPYIKGTCNNGYSYEMMKLQDPIAFVLGYKCNCCIRVKDIAHNHLLHATLCENGRILILYNEKHEIAGFSVLKRNGEVLIANSIECANKIKDDKAIECFTAAINKIASTSQNNPSETMPLSLVCIGNEAYAKPKGTLFPADVETPTILEKDDPTYSGTDRYHTKLDVIYKKPNLNLQKIKYGNPNISYLDERNKISKCDFNQSFDNEKEHALKVINAIRYTHATIEEKENFKLANRGISKCMYNDDWYVLLTYNNELYGDYINTDQRAIKEYTIALEEFKNNLLKLSLDPQNIIVKKLK